MANSVYSIPFPLVQGARTDHSNIEARLNGVAYLIKSISWDDSLEPGEVRANSPEAIGWTIGQYKASSSIELWKAEADLFELNMMADPSYLDPDGFHLGLKQIFFPVIVYYRQSSNIPFTSTWYMARITKSADSSAAGAEHQSRKYDCICTPIWRNGIPSFNTQSGE